MKWVRVSSLDMARVWGFKRVRVNVSSWRGPKVPFDQPPSQTKFSQDKPLTHPKNMLKLRARPLSKEMIQT